MQETISVAVLISIISLICTLINTFSGGKKTIREQDEKENNKQLEIEKNFVKINVKLDNFCETSNKLLAENAKKTDELRVVSEKLVTVNEKVSTLFKYKDEHDERLKELEEIDPFDNMQVFFSEIPNEENSNARICTFTGQYYLSTVDCKIDKELANIGDTVTVEYISKYGDGTTVEQAFAKDGCYKITRSKMEFVVE